MPGSWGRRTPRTRAAPGGRRDGDRRGVCERSGDTGPGKPFGGRKLTVRPREEEHKSGRRAGKGQAVKPGKRGGRGPPGLREQRGCRGPEGQVPQRAQAGKTLRGHCEHAFQSLQKKETHKKHCPTNTEATPRRPCRPRLLPASSGEGDVLTVPGLCPCVSTSCPARPPCSCSSQL